MFTGVMVDTLVHYKPVSMGWQWVMFAPTVVHVYGYEGSPCIYAFKPALFSNEESRISLKIPLTIWFTFSFMLYSGG